MRRIDEPDITAEMLENPLNDRRRLDAGDDTLAAAALAAGLGVDGEHPLGELRPAHRPIPIGDRCLAALVGSGGAGPGHDSDPIGARRCKHAMVPGKVRAGLGHQFCELRDGKSAGLPICTPEGRPTGWRKRMCTMNSSGSKITCVVPLRYGVFSA
jgi:hypothetical protein